MELVKSFAYIFHPQKKYDQIYHTLQVIQSDILSPQLEVTWPFKGSLNNVLFWGSGIF